MAKSQLVTHVSSVITSSGIRSSAGKDRPVTQGYTPANDKHGLGDPGAPQAREGTSAGKGIEDSGARGLTSQCFHVLNGHPQHSKFV